MQDGTAFPTVAIAIDKDKGSQIALKWALDHIIFKGQTVTLIHVDTKRSGNQEDAANAMRELFIPFRCFCKRKDKVYCKDVLLEGTDVAKAIIDFVSQAEIEKLVVGASSRGFVRFKTTDVATSVSKGAPDFCTVYVIAKGKVSSVRNARAAPPPSPLRYQIQNKSRLRSHSLEQRFKAIKGEAEHETRSLLGDRDSLRGSHIGTPRSNGDKMAEDSRSSDRSFHQRLSNISDYYDHSFEMMQSTPLTSSSMHHHHHSSLPPSCNDFLSSQEEIETEIRRLRLELKQTMVMYSTACKEALTAKQKAKELQRWKLDEDKRLEEARTAEEAALAIAEKERAKCSAAMEAAEASKRTAEAEAEKRRALEKLKEKETTTRYRRYSIGEIEKATERFAERRKIGEGGYGPVYRCHLDHTPVAVKVLRSDAAQGRSQFQQEVEILSSIRHPNMVLLLGACPEYGCLVYEYMANGSLEDRLFRRGNTPPLPWQHRFRIAAEIATGLLFLHQTKPKPLVHRDLKPANILLDRNYVSKISDVGLSRLVPPTVADSVTQYRVTAAAGTFCYIDPEYQQTGMLGTKSDVYSLGIMLLQLIAGKPPMGIKHWMEKTIEEGKFEELLDPAVPDWPVEEALRFARVSLQCAELRRKDRPDLGTVVLPELNRLRELADENMQHSAVWRGTYNMPLNNQVSFLDIRSGPRIQSEYDSSRSSRSRSGDGR